MAHDLDHPPTSARPAAAPERSLAAKVGDSQGQNARVQLSFDGKLFGMVASISEMDISAEVEFSLVLWRGDPLKQVRNILIGDRWAIQDAGFAV